MPRKSGKIMNCVVHGEYVLPFQAFILVGCTAFDIQSVEFPRLWANVAMLPTSQKWRGKSDPLKVAESACPIRLKPYRGEYQALEKLSHAILLTLSPKFSLQDYLPNPDENCFKIHWSSVLLSLVSYILLAITLLLCLSCFARVLIQWSVRSSLAELRFVTSDTWYW